VTEVYVTLTKMIMREGGGGGEMGGGQVKNVRHHIFQKASLRNETWQWPAMSDIVMG